MSEPFGISLYELSGVSDPDDDLLSRAREFRKHVASAEFRTFTKNLGKVVLPQRGNVMPAKARDGAGMTWLRMFRDYAGDRCIMFPFRTAATPRGRVQYNFRSMEAHRAMCIMVRGLPKEDGKDKALHACGNGHLGCVNPKHLYWGDHSDNVKDAHRHAKEGRLTA